MPRETYYQSTGNPTQKRNLPRRPMSIEFAYRSSNPGSDGTFTRTYFGNLYLLSGAANHWGRSRSPSTTPCCFTALMDNDRDCSRQS